MEVVIPEPNKVDPPSSVVEEKSRETTPPLPERDSHKGLFVDRGVGSPRIVKTSCHSTFTADLKLGSENKVFITILFFLE
jgi:6-phosphofructo-2-kinase / fructose-2,6-biphosphatase 3